MPSVGQGYTWFARDVLGFDEAFQGTLAQVGTGLALLGTWLYSDEQHFGSERARSPSLMPPRPRPAQYDTAADTVRNLCAGRTTGELVRPDGFPHEPGLGCRGLLTKYLNEAIVVARGDYASLPMLLACVMLIGFVIPIVTIMLCGRYVR
jgi:hypothetical protein